MWDSLWNMYRYALCALHPWQWFIKIQNWLSSIKLKQVSRSNFLSVLLFSISTRCFPAINFLDIDHLPSQQITDLSIKKSLAIGTGVLFSLTPSTYFHNSWGLLDSRVFTYILTTLLAFFLVCVCQTLIHYVEFIFVNISLWVTNTSFIRSYL